MDWRHRYDTLSGRVALATVLRSLVAGFLFAFAVVVLPDIGSLDDGGFIRAFQVIDRVIQDNQLLFVAVWLGSVLALAIAFNSKQRRYAVPVRLRSSSSSGCERPASDDPWRDSDTRRRRRAGVRSRL